MGEEFVVIMSQIQRASSRNAGTTGIATADDRSGSGPNDDEADVEEALLRRSSHAESLESLGIPWIHHGQRAGKKEHCAELGCCYFFRFTEESRGSSRVEPVHWRKVPRSAVAKVGKSGKSSQGSSGSISESGPADLAFPAVLACFRRACPRFPSELCQWSMASRI